MYNCIDGLIDLRPSNFLHKPFFSRLSMACAASGNKRRKSATYLDS